MIKGVNRALSYKPIYEEANSRIKECIFISHKSEDIKAAKAVAEVIMSNGVDVYLDVNDSGLQSATRENDSQKIVDCIENALLKSSHICVLVTNKTKESWWVPYEVGYAKNGEKNIASLLLKDVYDFPDFLKIERKLRGLSDLKNYIKEISGQQAFYENLNESINYRNIEHEVLNYIRG